MNKRLRCFLGVFIAIALLIFSSAFFAFAISDPYVYAKLDLDDISTYSAMATGTYKLFALRVGTHSEKDVCIDAQCSVGEGWLTTNSVYVAPGHSIDNHATTVLSQDALWRLHLHTRYYLKGGSGTGYMWYAND